MNVSQLLEPTSPPLYALICAAGVGARAGGDVPKQYQTINGVPMLAHSIRALATIAQITRVYVVISPDDGDYAHIMPPFLAQFGLADRMAVLTVGGATRAQSVRNGLAMLDELDDGAWVLVHDAARPCVSTQAVLRLRDAVLQAAQQAQQTNADQRNYIGGLLAVPVTDTVKHSADGTHSKKTIDRSALWTAQTPQMFTVNGLYQTLCDALVDQAVAKTITDEASVMEWAGYAPLLVQGESRNLKVTYSQDFALAEFYLDANESCE